MFLKTNFTENLIAFSIIMLMLSLISERLANFIKLYFGGKKIFIPFFHYSDKPFSWHYENLKFGLKANLRILSTKQPTKSAEKEREYRILAINILIGISVATLTNANFFQIIEEIPKLATNNGNESINFIKGWQFDFNAAIDRAKVLGAVFHVMLVWSLSLMFFNRLYETENPLKYQWRVQLPFYFLCFTLSLIFLLLKIENEEIKQSIWWCVTIVSSGVFLWQLYFLIPRIIKFFRKKDDKNYNEIQNYGQEKLTSSDILKVVLTYCVYIFAIVFYVIYYSKSEKEFSNTLLTSIQHSFGFIITGLFLSMGSKFWHDLLDVLFKFKNIRRTLNTKSTYTDFDSPEKLIRLAETSHYEVADKLFEKYSAEIEAMLGEGVVSLGLISDLDEIDGFYKRKIEVEYTNEIAEQRLQKLARTGFVTVNYNKFYLRDYLKLTYTEDLIALIDNTDSSNSSRDDIIKKITKDPPICYAYNVKNEQDKIFGSFNIVKKDDGYYAESNLHVFASQSDFEQFENTNASFEDLKDLDVTLKIGNKPYPNCEIKDGYLESNGTRSRDYAICKINGMADNDYENYKKLIDYDKLINPEINDEMLMFGATSKDVKFEKLSYGKNTLCSVKYSGFRKEMYLFKTERTYSNINKGDSGSVVYYRIKRNNKIYLKKAMVVAKSRSHTYMFFLNN